MDGLTDGRTGTVVRISGPLVEVDGVEGVSMLEVVAVGPARISAETVAITGGRATLQAYEYTGGLKAGDVAEATGHELSALLGPGLLGQVFDGLMRPLSSAPLWLTPDRAGSMEDAATLARSWTFVPASAAGASVSPGDVLGTVPGAGSVEHRVLVPFGVFGEVTWLAPESQAHALDVVARVGDREVLLAQRWPVRRPRPFRGRLTDVVPLHTGQRVLDLMFPLSRGAAAAVPGGFGTGKTLLLQQIARWGDADVIVYVGCGERGNEMAELLEEFTTLSDPWSGRPLMERTIVVVNTSNMPVAAREASIYTAVTMAEYYRDMGYHVLLLADSISRWAEALREISSSLEEMPGEEGYPTYLTSRLAAFFERAGVVETLGG
ncbi:MAG TPA: V-type ATP synthase subunit A, partial [Dermatophilaceae bacterium]